MNAAGAGGAQFGTALLRPNLFMNAAGAGGA